MKKFLLASGVIATCCLLAAANSPGEHLTGYFKNLEKRATKGQDTLAEKAALGAVYNGMIGVGYFLYPEASKVLYHFCHGDGRRVEIDSSYIQNSTAIQKRLKKLRPGQSWKGWIKQSEDRRLTYAYNPIKIENLGSKVRVSSKVRVVKLGKGVYTRIYMGDFTFDLPDSLMRVGCKAKEYTAYTEWTR